MSIEFPDKCRDLEPEEVANVAELDEEPEYGPDAPAGSLVPDLSNFKQPVPAPVEQPVETGVFQPTTGKYQLGRSYRHVNKEAKRKREKKEPAPPEQKPLTKSAEEQTNQIVWQTAELTACKMYPAYFISHYCQIFDNEMKAWVPFDLWDAQQVVLHDIDSNKQIVILKARQLGMTWLCLGYMLWLMLFKPVASCLVFSRREEEAKALLGDERLRGMFKRLPEWMRPATTKNDVATWMLSNGSVAHCFPTTAGDSYTATYVLCDEFDLLDLKDQVNVMRAVKPTMDSGGKLILLSRSDKTKPTSFFKSTYLEARKQGSVWKGVFLPWWSRPGRTRAWYDAEYKSWLDKTGSVDYMYEAYPGSDVEAMSPASSDKRIPAEWLLRCYKEQEPLRTPPGAPGIFRLNVYVAPIPGHEYVLGLDPAAGNPTSDDSSLHVLDKVTGEECAGLSGKFEPAVFASHAANVSAYYNDAPVMCELNNHGHAVILWLADNSHVRILTGLDGKPGWTTTSKSKALLYDTASTCFRDKETILHSRSTYLQLSLIEGASLKAPEPFHDDAAVSYVLALAAIARPQKLREPGIYTAAVKRDFRPGEGILSDAVKKTKDEIIPPEPVKYEPELVLAPTERQVLYVRAALEIAICQNNTRIDRDCAKNRIALLLSEFPVTDKWPQDVIQTWLALQYKQPTIPCKTAQTVPPLATGAGFLE